MNVEKFRKYWERIGKPKLECEDDSGKWFNALPDWTADSYRIKGYRHWELRQKWIESDFTLPIEKLISTNRLGDELWAAVDEPAWNQAREYREAVLESKSPEPDADGWIPHTPGDPAPALPDGAVDIEAKRRDGGTFLVRERTDRNLVVSWNTIPGITSAEIVAYRPVFAEVKYSEPDADGWIPHTPEDLAPVMPKDATAVSVKFRDGTEATETYPSGFNWGAVPRYPYAEIIAYKFIYRTEPTAKGNASDGSSAPIAKYEVEFTEPTHPYPELGVNHPLHVIYMDAIAQATGGKGKRHGGAETPFLDQPWHQIAKHTGFRGLVFQAVKKAQEACGKGDFEAFERELLGAIVYAGAALIYARKHGYTKEVKVDG